MEWGGGVRETQLGPLEKVIVGGHGQDYNFI